MPVRVQVDQHKCVAAGVCITAAESVFMFGDDWAVALRGAAEPAGPIDLPGELEGLVREAADSCPSGAIAVSGNDQRR